MLRMKPPKKGGNIIKVKNKKQLNDMLKILDNCKNTEEVKQLCRMGLDFYTKCNHIAQEFYLNMNISGKNRNNYNLENSIDFWIRYLKKYENSTKKQHQPSFISYAMYCIADFLPNRSQPFQPDTPIDNPSFFYPIVNRLTYQFNAMAEFFIIKKIIDMYPNAKIATHRTLDCVFGIDVVVVHEGRVALIHITKDSYYLAKSFGLKGSKNKSGACRDAKTGKDLRWFNGVRNFSDETSRDGELTNKHQAIVFRNCDGFKYQILNEHVLEHLFDEENTYRFTGNTICEYLEKLRRKARIQEQGYEIKYIPRQFKLITGDDYLHKLPSSFEKWFDEVEYIPSKPVKTKAKIDMLADFRPYIKKKDDRFKPSQMLLRRVMTELSE